MEVTDMGIGAQFHMTMVYAFNDVNERKLCGRSCVDLKGIFMALGLWGNCITEEMEDFKNYVDDCEVSDCPVSGSLCTWNNKQEVATRSMNDDTKKRRHFKYYNMWSKLEDFKKCVQRVWDKDWYGSNMFRLTKKLKSLKMPLKNLNKTDFADVENNATRARMILEHIQEKLWRDPLNAGLVQQEIEAASAFRFLDQASHEYLIQKSKAVWMEKEDHNTKYFHSLIKNRQVQNKIMKIEDVKGNLCEDATHIENAFLDFYMELLGADVSTSDVSLSTVQMGRV
ncbi:uncharacterized protein LOC141614221 [Silene latifolia]|uniref:uncharacterized protein LOC141614221 n=1 Tax=Silene latifolia TaxID=37657 RepID=UPI003D773F01